MTAAAGSMIGCAVVLGIGDLPPPPPGGTSVDATSVDDSKTPRTDSALDLDAQQVERDAADETGVVTNFVGCGGDPNCRVVFVTKQPFNAGLFGSIGGADTKCMQAAASPGLPALSGRTFKAWLSDVSEDARDHVSLVDNERYVRVDGALVADNKTDLLDGTLKNAINVDETGGVQAAGETWTGSNANGTRTTEVCGGWTNPNGMGTAGKLTALNGEWSSSNFGTVCGIERHLYCFQTD